jgi:uroporphyrinogen-III synthase
MAEGGSGRTDVASMQVGRVQVQLRGDHVVVDGVSIDLAPRERHVLAVLGHRPGCVVNKQQLLVAVWNSAVDSHAVEVTVGRLRRRLEGRLDIQTVPRRGYRLIEPAR